MSERPDWWDGPSQGMTTIENAAFDRGYEAGADVILAWAKAEGRRELAQTVLKWLEDHKAKTEFWPEVGEVGFGYLEAERIAKQLTEEVFLPDEAQQGEGDE